MSAREQANEKRRAQWAARSVERKKMLAGPELYEAAKEAEAQIRYLHEKFQETGSGNAALTKLDAALKLADEGGTGRTL